MITADRIRKEVRNKTFKVPSGTLTVSLSFGISTFKPEKTKEKLISEADQSLYSAKHAGKDCVVSYSQLTRSSLESHETPELPADKKTTAVNNQTDF